jgi:desulfoferrodoxin (superoxide reductase-like protein)
MYVLLQVQNVKPQAITRKKDTKHAVALDSENNNVSVKDIVKVVDGPHSVCKLLHFIEWLRLLTSKHLPLTAVGSNFNREFGFFHMRKLSS